MNEENQKNQMQDNAPKTDGATPASASAWKRTTNKKWVFPAVYMAAAAIILALMWVYQDAGTNAPMTDKDRGLETTSGTAVKSPTTGKTAVPANATKAEQMKWPAAKEANAKITMPFFDSNASNDVKQAAIVEYGDSFTPHMGIDLSRDDGQPFDVLAALSGKVTRFEQVPLIGNVVEIEHEGGLKTVYQSLADVKVKKGDQVKQGELIAKAGRNELDKNEGIHVHFEVLLDNQPVNPETYLTDKQ